MSNRQSGQRSRLRGRSGLKQALIVAVWGLIAPSVAIAQETPDLLALALDPEAVLVAELVETEVTFVDPFGITEASDLRIGAYPQIAADPQHSIVVPDRVNGGDTTADQGRAQFPAMLTITAAPYQPITIHVDKVVAGDGYSLSDFRCNYNEGSDVACDGPGFTEISVANGTLLVGATLIGNGTRAAGAADGSFEVTVSYQ